MKRVVFIICICLGYVSNAQRLYKKVDVDSPITTFSNYGTSIFITGDEGVYYLNNKALDVEGKTLVQVSPLGNQSFIVSETHSYYYDNFFFEVLTKDRLPKRDLEPRSIVSDTYGAQYFMADSNGTLYVSSPEKNLTELREINLPFFVSQIAWNSNTEKLLVADDIRLLYVDPKTQKTTKAIRFEHEITSLLVDTKNFRVFVGLSNGIIQVFNQELSENLHTWELSKTSISAMQLDQRDHYLYVGDDNGMVYTFDLLKERAIQVMDEWNGSITLGLVEEPLKGSKHILVGALNGNGVSVYETTGLEPNYRRIIEKELAKTKNAFAKIRMDETAAAYDDRVTEASIQSIVERRKTELVDSIARTKTDLLPLFDLQNDSLEVSISPFPPIALKNFGRFQSMDNLSIERLHFSLEKDNTFSIMELEVSDGSQQLKYSADARTMQRYEQEISIDQLKQIANTEREFKQSLASLVEDLRSKGSLNDVELSVEAVLKKEKDENGNDELNLHVTYISRGVKAEAEKETSDFKAGQYDIMESVAATTLVGFFIKSTSDKLGEYLAPGRKVTFNLTGSTDKSGIMKSLPYGNEFGSFTNFPFYFQGQLAGLNLTPENGITTNSQLGFLRTYSVRNFIENYTDLFDQTENKFIHFSEESDQYGPEYRKIKIEMVIHKIAEVNTAPNSEVEETLSDVDVDIPSGPIVEGYALVIGNEDYSSFQKGLAKESNVPYAVRDAEVFKNYLHQLYHIPQENIDFIANGTYGEMSQAIAKLERLMELDGEGKDIVIYYSGHGMPEENTKDPYLIPVDISGLNVAQGISLKALMARLAQKPHERITFVIDACFSGLGKVEPLSSVKGITVTPVNPELGEHMVLLSSSSGNESSVVDDSNLHGLFTYHLLKNLKENVGDIPLEQLYEKVRKDVGLSAIKNLNKVQTPSLMMGEGIKQKATESGLIGN